MEPAHIWRQKPVCQHRQGRHSGRKVHPIRTTSLWEVPLLCHISRPNNVAALNAISAAQAHTTTTTMGDIIWLLNYAATHPDATIHYHYSDMILYVASDASYLCKERTCSRAGGHFFLADRLVENDEKPPTLLKNNDAIHTLCQIIKTVISPEAEAEIGATFINSKENLPILTNLKELGHPQPPTTMQVYNTTSVGFANNTIKQKRSKAIDMRF